MSEKRRESRTEVKPSSGEELHIASGVVVINKGVNAKIHIVDPQSVTINKGVNNIYYIYTADRHSVRVVQNGGVNLQVYYRDLDQYNGDSKDSPSATNFEKKPPTVVGERQVRVGGTVGGQIITDNREYKGGFTGRTETAHSGQGVPDISQMMCQMFDSTRREQSVNRFEQCEIDAIEAQELGIEKGIYFLDTNLQTSLAQSGGSTYSLVTTSSGSGAMIGLGGGRMGYAVQKNGKYVYRKI